LTSEAVPRATRWSAVRLATGYRSSLTILDAGLLLLGALLAVILAWLLLTFGNSRGNLFAPAMVLGFIFVVAAIWRNPMVGPYILMAAAVLIEENPLGFGASLTDQIPIFHDINGIMAVRGVYLNSIEVILLITAAAWLLRSEVSGRPHFQTGPIFLPFTAFIGMILLGVVHGVLTGGDIKISFWTIRAIAYIYLAYLLTIQILKDRRQLDALIWIFIIGVAIKGAIGWWRYYVNLQTDLSRLTTIPGVNSLMAHEESFFFVALILLAVVQFLYGAPRKQKTLTLLAVPLVMIPLLANQRRASVMALFVGLVALAVVSYALLHGRRRLILSVLVVSTVVVPLYSVLFWNSSGLIGEPVQAIKSGFQPDARDFASNAYRDAENVNLKFTVRKSPLVGIGFGKEMVMQWPLPDISQFFAWYRIVPHNTILWIMMTTGIAGFILFWYWIGTTVLQGCLAARRLVGKELQGLMVYGMLMLIALLVFALLDQGFLSLRVTLFVGILLGVTFAIPRLETQEGSHRAD
jgi:hypothetical protein